MEADWTTASEPVVVPGNQEMTGMRATSCRPAQNEALCSAGYQTIRQRGQRAAGSGQWAALSSVCVCVRQTGKLDLNLSVCVCVSQHVAVMSQSH